NYSLDIKESRRTCKLPLRFLIHGESEKINLEEGWTAEYAGRFHEGVALNIDSCGFLVATNPDRIPSLGETISAIFQLEGVNEKVKVEAEVVWVNKYSNQYPKGFAVKFTDVSVNAKTLRDGIDKSEEKVKLKGINGLNLLNIPD
ncbi:MAG: hypothetical protein AMJ42_04500, partial [Deltaproteobacteria bacterium DG_8]